jgi:hypothetical protein
MVDSDPMQFDVPHTESDITDEQRLIVHVRTILCGTECFPSFEVDSIVRRFKCGVSSARNGRLTTWVPMNSYPILIAGTSTIGNVVIALKTGVAYSLSAVMEIPILAAGVVIIGNCTLDYDESFRLLIYDAENLPPTSADTLSLNPNSVERYERLRDFFPRYLQCTEALRSTIILQWLGHYEHAVKFLTGEINVGHKIGGLVCTTDDAMTPTRPVRVTVPSITIGRFKQEQ